ncbi:HIPL1 protein [Acorus calamus]|uniref:HIPL1 protein n=1 Tax=Acorus calamus TaxID=4465 RepID=A0AAV9ESS5_ACOCL|nr:HIPL1 protein [Acorus calamus]
MGVFPLVFLCTLFLFFPSHSALPLCTNSEAPFKLKTPLVFCPYNESSCCDAAADSAIQKRFQAKNVSDPACASVVKSVLCAKCDPFSAELFKVDSQHQSIPVLCNSTATLNSSQSKDVTENFCVKVWDTCQKVSILNSPFASPLQGSAGLVNNSTAYKLTDLWQSQDDFCNAIGGSTNDQSVCFDGKSVLLNDSQSSMPSQGVCLERIGDGYYLNMVAHPDGSDRVFVSNQKGQIYLASIPEQDSGKALELDESNPFLDLTDEVKFDSEFGLMGIAFHPQFATNGRFFVSFNCDKVKSASCSGRCSCNSDVDCDPSKLPSDGGAQPCQYQSIIAEYTANGTSSTPSSATTASSIEVRRIFTMGLPFTSHHGGQILFGPTDGHLYFMMGDGGNKGDPYNFAQNKKSLLGKIMRLDVDNVPSATQISKLGLWGNYSIPNDNPSFNDNALQPEIWALGLRNPWRCSFDAERPSYFFCADVGQEVYEEVNLVSKGGNYGWRTYEGPYLYMPLSSPGGNTTPNSINVIYPIMGYNHSSVNINEGSASITGGYVYRSTTDPCLSGKYLYADLYASAMWEGVESPVNSGKYNSTLIPFSCARDSPLQCDSVAGSSLASLGFVVSFGEDNKKDLYVLAKNGVYRVVRPSRCKYTCPKENVSDIGNPSPGPSSSIASQLDGAVMMLSFLSFSAFLLLFLSL